jgi:prepilin-type N-terminal cleavage/methylation domain-containing protein
MQTQAAQRRAFTLLEMGIVIVVIAIVSVTVMPAWNSLTGTRQAAAGEEVERRLVMARSLAVSEGHPVGVRIDPAADTVQFWTITTTGAAPTVMTMFDGMADPLVDLAKTYPAADVTAVVDGAGASGAATLWFGYDGSPEERSAVGALVGSWSTDAVVTLAGGSVVTVRKGTGMVQR